ncbi:MAG TPA: DUF4383 domain-containing protein [Candidatus Dormibacteraeota bacterium]|nr:DUF4383 domain-containing protein [Candidatus Dormibacteraeota bacterium]
MTQLGNRATVQRVAFVFGAIYLAVGIIGFLPFLGGSVTMTNGKLLGLFNINLLHNLVHVVIGIAGLAAVTSLPNSRRFCQVVGVVLLLLGVLGVFVASPLGLLYIGQLDIPLHLVTGAVLAYFGFAAPVSTRSV